MAQSLVEQGLAGCVQISEIESIYRWHGTVQNEHEFLVLCKTAETKYADLEQAIRALHSYELPEIHAYAIERIYEPYAAWFEDGCQSP